MKNVRYNSTEMSDLRFYKT